MTSTSNPDQKRGSAFDRHPCHLSGNWLPFADLCISAEDLGFKQGVSAVERLRTYLGRPFQVDAHLRRWHQTIESLEIQGLPNAAEIEALLSQLMERNRSLISRQNEVGITMFATPGCVGQSAPTFCVHLNQLDRRRIERRREQGQPLVVTEIQQPSQECWPRTIKVRSRIHYYLADTKARKSNEDAIGVLIDSDGSATETSIANLAMVRDRQIISPPSDTILSGITQKVVESLATELGIDWHKRTIDGNDLRRADEILLMGTDGGIWFANSVDGQAVGGGKPGEIYRLLRNAFDQATVGGRSNF